MHKITRFIASMALCAMALVSVPMAPAMAADAVLTGPALTYTPNIFLYATREVDLGTAYTNATTTATIIASASGTTAVTVPATLRDYSKQYLRVCWRVVASKATSTTGTIYPFINGAAYTTASQAVTTAATNGNLSGCATVARSSAAAQTVSLYGVSGDTAVFTVSDAYIEVWNITLGG